MGCSRLTAPPRSGTHDTCYKTGAEEATLTFYSRLTAAVGVPDQGQAEHIAYEGSVQPIADCRLPSADADTPSLRLTPTLPLCIHRVLSLSLTLSP